MRLLKIIKPLTRRLTLVRVPDFCLESQFEHLTAVVFSSLTYHNVKLDPQIKVNIDQSIDLSGSIMITAHFYLNFFALRWLYDQGYSNSTVMLTGTDDWKILGTDVSLKMILPYSRQLVNFKRLTAEGEILTLCIDHTEARKGWHKLESLDREIYATDRIIKFAERQNIPIHFFATRVDQTGQVTLRIVPATTSQSALVLKEYEYFLGQILACRPPADVSETQSFQNRNEQPATVN